MEFKTYLLTMRYPLGARVRHTLEVDMSRLRFAPERDVMADIANRLGGTLLDWEVVADYVVPA